MANFEVENDPLHPTGQTTSIKDIHPYERARLILVGRVKQIRHGEGYPRFARVGSFGDHFLFENAMDFGGVACDPCKNQCKMGNPL